MTIVLSLRFEGLAGVAVRRAPFDLVDVGAVSAESDIGERGSEGVGEAMPESCSREVSEMRIDGLSGTGSSGPGFFSRN